MEVETCQQSNPLVQDIKKDKETGMMMMRHYGVEPMFNYGMIPQTWENNAELDPETGCVGDNDPLDIVDLTNRDMNMMEMPRMKILGSLCLID